MSGHAPVLLLCPLTPPYMDFFPDLVNNYRTVYVYSAIWESQVDFSLCLARKVLTSERDRISAESFCKCQIVGGKKILLKKVLSEIAKQRNDCMLFLGGLEALSPSFDLSLIEYLMDNCPDNLKIVLCSETVPHILYKIGDRVFPRTILCDDASEALPFDDALFTDGYLSAEQLSFLYHISVLPIVEKDFAESIFKGAKDLLGAISRTYRSALISLGNAYCLHPDFHSIMKKYVSYPEENTDFVRDYLAFCFNEKRYDLTVEKAIDFGNLEYVEKSAMELVLSGREDTLYSVFKQTGFSAPGSMICETIQKCIERKYEEAICFAREIKEKKVSEKFYNVLSFLTASREEAFVKLCRDFEECPERFLIYLRIVSLLSYSERKRLGMQPGIMKLAEKMFSEGEDDVTFLHFMSRIHAATGNYVAAKEYLIRLRQVCDYYPYSFVQSWIFFFNMSLDTLSEYAQETSNRLLECCSYLYRGNQARALACLKTNLEEEVNTPEGYLSLALQCLFFAESGDPEFGSALSLLYAVSCEREKKEECMFFYTSLAYCEWMSRNNEKALEYLQKSKNEGDAFFSFFARALEIDCNLEKERSSVLDKQIEKLLLLAKEKGYDNAIIVLRSCFMPLLTYAEKRNILPEYVFTIYDSITKRKETGGKKNLQLKFFGSSAVYVDRREISWKTKKCKELFLLYALNPEGLDRNEIISEVWSDYVYTSAVNNLKTTNNLIRKTLKEQDIIFEFVYVNGKYKLITETCENDYSNYQSILKEYEASDDIRKRMLLLGRLVSYCEEGFASDCECPGLKRRDTDIKDELSLLILALIKELIKLNDFINAKRFLSRLEKLHRFDCERLKIEIDNAVTR